MARSKGFVFPDRIGTGLYFATANRVVGLATMARGLRPVPPGIP